MGVEHPLRYVRATCPGAASGTSGEAVPSCVEPRAACLVEYREEGRVIAQIDERALDQAICARARGLARCGLAGARAVLLIASPLEFLITFHACLLAGIVAVPVAPPERRRPERWALRLAAILADAGTELVLTTGDFEMLIKDVLDRGRCRARIENVALIEAAGSEDAALDAGFPRRLAGDTAFLQYTSGSTGAPRGVRVTFGNIEANVRLCSERFALGCGTRIVSWLPLFHDMGLMSGVLLPVALGAPVCLFSTQEFLEKPSRWLRAISEFRGQVSGAPNFAYDLVSISVKDEDVGSLDLSSWRTAFNGAEPVRADTIRRFAARFAAAGFSSRAVAPCYGLAEATLLVTGSAVGAGAALQHFDAAEWDRGVAQAASDGEGCGRWLVSSGRLPDAALPWATELRVVDPASLRACTERQIGEIWLRGPSVSPGYHRPSEDGADQFAAYLADGTGPYLRTGDLGCLVEGELFIAGRRKDVVIVHGRNHYPQDIESSVESLSRLVRRGCVVCSVIRRAEAERAVVVAELPSRVFTQDHGARGLSDSLRLEAERIRGGIAEESGLNLAAVVFVKAGEVSKTTSGKLQRGLTVSRWEAGELDVVAVHEFSRTFAGASSEGWTPQERVIARIWCEVLGLDEVGRDEHFLDLGGDSVRATAMLARVSEQLGVWLELHEAFEHATVEQLSRLVDMARSRPSAERAESIGL